MQSSAEQRKCVEKPNGCLLNKKPNRHSISSHATLKSIFSMAKENSCCCTSEMGFLFDNFSLMVASSSREYLVASLCAPLYYYAMQSAQTENERCVHIPNYGYFSFSHFDSFFSSSERHTERKNVCDRQTSEKHAKSIQNLSNLFVLILSNGFCCCCCSSLLRRVSRNSCVAFEKTQTLCVFVCSNNSSRSFGLVMT